MKFFQEPIFGFESCFFFIEVMKSFQLLVECFSYEHQLLYLFIHIDRNFKSNITKSNRIIFSTSTNNLNLKLNFETQFHVVVYVQKLMYI